MRRSRMLVGLLLSCAWATAGATSAQVQGRGFGPATLAPTGMEVYTGAPVEGREAVREFGTGK